MRPIRLKIIGINSFMEEQIINFQKLTDCGIFGIVGDTGSGKSTIVDSIIIALYGRIPRFNSTNKDFINCNRSNAFISFEFIISVNGKDENFTIERSYQRNKNGDIKETISRLIKNEKIEFDKIKEINKKIFDLIGLTYEDFTKAVILPQGKFSDFLTLKNEDRREMLERIFNLEKYGKELSKKIRDSFIKNKNELALVEKSLENFSGIDEESISSLKSEKQKLNVDLINFNMQKKIVTKILEQEKNNLILVEELNLAEKNMKILLNDKEKIVTLENALKESYKVCGLIENLNRLTKSKKSLKELNVNCKILLDKCEKNKNIYNEKQLNYNKQEILKDKNAEIFSEKINNCKRAISLLDELNEKTQELKNMRNNYKLAKENLTEKQKLLMILSEKMQSESKIIDQQKIEKEKNTITQSDRNFVSKGLAYEAKNKELQKIIFQFEENLKIQNKIIENKINNIKELKNKIIASEDKFQVLKNNQQIDLENNLINLKKNLKKGDLCPVCGEKIKDNLILTNLELKSHSFDKKEYEKLEKLIIDLKINLQTEKENLKFNLNEQKQVKLNLDIINSEVLENNLILSEMLKNKNYNCFENEYNLIDLKSNLFENISKNISQLETSLQLKLPEFENLKFAITQTEKEVEKFELEGKTIKLRFDEIESEIKKLSENYEPKKYLIQLENDKIKNFENFNLIKEELLKLKDLVQSNLNELNKIQTESKFLKNIIDEESKLLSEKMESLGLVKIEEITSKFIDTEKRVEIEKEVEIYNKNLLVSENNLKKLKNQTKYLKVYEIENNYQKLFNENAEIEQNISNITLEIGSKNNAIESMEAKLPIVINLKKNKISLENILDILKILTKLFAGNRFVDFIAKRHLKYISFEGSKRLMQMTNNKYSIELDDVDFVIKDFSRGGMLRSTKSLSGGEIFIVSLCLSLALSSKVQLKNNGSLDMFFLDEGFGTLDVNSLENVMNNLFSLVNDKMKIGLITHVEELKNCLPRKLVVTSGGFEVGSSVHIE